MRDERPENQTGPKGVPTDGADAARRPGKRRSDRDARKMEPQIGRALRSVYDETVGEDIPPEMLELLGKLS